LATTGHTYEQLRSAFQHGNVKPLYFFYGEETFLMEELQNLLIEKLLAPHERDFNLDVVYGAETDAQTVLGLCTGYPMMAARRVVVVRDFDKLKDNRLFTSFAERPNPSAVVLLLCSSKPNLTAHPYRALREHAVWSEFKPLYDNQIPGWIQQRVEQAGYKIEPQAVQMLADYVGTNLRAVDAEIDKLITYAGGRKHLTGDDVIRAAGQTREYNVFELQKAIGQGRYADSIRILDRMLSQATNVRGEALMIVTVLSSYFIKLWKLALAKDQDVPEKTLASHIGVSPFFLKEYLFSLRRFTAEKIDRAFSALLAADYELKGGAHRDERLILTLLMRQLVNGSAGDGVTGRILSS
jgi:DNA polymerase-3 subunit delta